MKFTPEKIARSTVVNTSLFNYIFIVFTTSLYHYYVKKLLIVKY